MSIDYKPVIGKNVLETLTTGMYDDPRFIFREYIQNAADQIDLAFELKILDEKSDGKITINIIPEEKKITVEDNATGIKSEDILQFLGDVANSQKNQIERKGFRGIGRLGGLGYCDRLVFETSYKGESIKNKITLDAKQLRNIFKDKKETSDASTVISIITNIENSSAESDAHYFIVSLENVNNDKLLNEVSVREYLSMVAPVPFSTSFSFAKEIKNHYENNNIILDEYHVVLNNDDVFKAYKDSFSLENGTTSTFVGVDFIEIRGDEQELLALCWYGYRDFSNIVLNSYEKGIRIRLKNITIGDESTCKRFFDAERTNLRFIGEIHTVSDSFIPNSRRDYFNENNTCLLFEEKAKLIFQTENLENRLAQTASKLHNRKREIDRYKSMLTEFETAKSTFQSASVESYYLNKLKNAKEKAYRASKDIEKIKAKSQADTNVEKLFTHIIGDDEIVIDPGFDLEVSKYDPPVFSKLTTNESNVVNEIFNILEENLSFEESELIKRTIIERYNS